MIQITNEMRKQLKREEERQARIEKCLSYLKIVTVDVPTAGGLITFAAVNSTSHGGRYIVYIDESAKIPHATRCKCPATKRCVHMDAVDQYYQNIAALFAKEEVTEPVVEETVSLEQAMQETQDAVTQIIEEAAIAGDKSYDEAMTAAYETLATTKKVSHAYGCCGHIVKLEDAGELCGPCRCK